MGKAMERNVFNASRGKGGDKEDTGWSSQEANLSRVRCQMGSFKMVVSSPPTIPTFSLMV